MATAAPSDLSFVKSFGAGGSGASPAGKASDTVILPGPGQSQPSGDEPEQKQDEPEQPPPAASNAPAVSAQRAEITLKKLLLVVVGLVLVIAGFRGKLGATLAVFLVPNTVVEAG